MNLIPYVLVCSFSRVIGKSINRLTRRRQTAWIEEKDALNIILAKVLHVFVTLIKFTLRKVWLMIV